MKDVLELPPGIIKRIHVNQHNIRANGKAGNTDMPVLSVVTSRGTSTGYHVEILGPSSVIYRPDKPLSCGAKVWMETKAAVLLKETP